MNKPENKAVLDLIDAAHQTIRLLEELSHGDSEGAHQVRCILGGPIGSELRAATDRALLTWVRQRA